MYGQESWQTGEAMELRVQSLCINPVTFSETRGMGKSRFTVMNAWNSEFILILFIYNYWIIINLLLPTTEYAGH